MVASKTIKNKFNYGDTVYVQKGCEQEKSITIGSVCSFRFIDDEEIAENLSIPLETFVYLVENEDGASYEIPEKYLKLG
ncbi:MAG: hypothetical protein KAJ86_07490 [Alphaproteobacteria bacterium]|nr:hypothetical protein [Alphaproteobacteria bacterium]